VTYERAPVTCEREQPHSGRGMMVPGVSRSTHEYAGFGIRGKGCSGGKSALQRLKIAGKSATPRAAGVAACNHRQIRSVAQGIAAVKDEAEKPE